MTKQTKTKSLVGSLVVGALVALAPQPASAELDLASKRIAELNHQALEQYDLLEFDNAKKFLLDAVQIAEKEALEDKIVAKTHLHLGATYIAGYKDLSKGLAEMQKAVRMDPELKMTPSIKNASVLKAFDKAKAELVAERIALEKKLASLQKERAEREAAERARVEAMLAQKAAERAAKNEAAKKAGEKQIAAAAAAQKKEAGEVEEPAPAPAAAEAKSAAPSALAEMVDPETVEGLKCPAAPELPARRPLALRCALDKTIEAGAVFAFYRPMGREDFTPQIMKKSAKGWWEAVINGDIVSTPGVEMYFEARDKKGRPIAADGNAGSPKQINVRAGSNLAGGAAPTRVLAAQ